MALTNIWNKPGNPVNLDHACFDGLAATIRDAIAAV
jgi:hypothetical protein